MRPTKPSPASANVEDSGICDPVRSISSHVTPPESQGGGFSLSGSKAAGVICKLDAATNLALPVNWVLATNAIAEQNGLFQLADTQAFAFQ
jgi:hypothetical protein